MLPYPNLLLVIRTSGMPQYEVAQLAGLREGRLSEIVRRGGAKPRERQALSRALSAGEAFLFDREIARAQSQDEIALSDIKPVSGSRSGDPNRSAGSR